MSRVYVYTTFDQHEEPLTIYHVTALALVGDGLLTIEAEKDGGGATFRAFHRFEPGKWARFTVGSDAPLSKKETSDV